MRRIYHFPIIRNMSTCNQIFKRSGYVEITRHEVQTVRRSFQEFKYPFSDYLSCLVSRMWTGIDFLRNYFWYYRPFRFVRLAGFSSSVKGAQ
jgi:hypothetical protein